MSSPVSPSFIASANTKSSILSFDRNLALIPIFSASVIKSCISFFELPDMIAYSIYKNSKCLNYNGR